MPGQGNNSQSCSLLSLTLVVTISSLVSPSSSPSQLRNMKGGLVGVERGEREEGSTCGQDGEQFEDCLRRCQAIEQKLTQQVNSTNDTYNILLLREGLIPFNPSFMD